nr:120_t:CDS:2 [Entrophospora candida]CAG8461066.1 2204_t:CDS:2 [Entrophospora candida]
MGTENLYRYSNLRGLWSKRNDEIDKQVETILSPHEFFDKYRKEEFYTGIDEADKRQYLLVSEETVRRLHSEIEKIVSKTLPFPSNKHNSHYQIIKKFYMEPTDFQKVEKNINDYNKNFKVYKKKAALNDRLMKAKKLCDEKKYLFIAIDVESYERDHTCILEVGWSMYNSKSDLFMDRHFCVKEYMHLRNNKYVADMKDRFIFGDSVWESSENIALEFTKDATQKEFVRENEEFNDVILIGHDIAMEKKYLERMEIKIDEVIKPKEVFDTAELDGARTGNVSQRPSLGGMLDDLKIENYCLHNAGNDAHYTMCAFLEICKLPITNVSPPEIKS